jgi:hypothetical protein
VKPLIGPWGFRAPASAASSSIKARVWASSAIRSQREAGDRRATGRDSSGAADQDSRRGSSVAPRY